MTTTTTEPIGNTWVEVADSTQSVEAVTIQNYEAMKLSVAIDPEAPGTEERGIYINAEDKEPFAGFEGKVWLRYPLLEDGKTLRVGVMKS